MLIAFRERGREERETTEPGFYSLHVPSTLPQTLLGGAAQIFDGYKNEWESHSHWRGCLSPVGELRRSWWSSSFSRSPWIIKSVSQLSCCVSISLFQMAEEGDGGAPQPSLRTVLVTILPPAQGLFIISDKLALGWLGFCPWCTTLSKSQVDLATLESLEASRSTLVSLHSGILCVYPYAGLEPPSLPAFSAGARLQGELGPGPCEGTRLRVYRGIGS